IDPETDTADTLSYSLSGDPIAGLTLNTDGSWSFNPADPAYDSLTDGQQQTITVNYTVSDNNGGVTNSSFSINLSGTNDLPLADLVAPQNTTEGADAISGQLSSTDPDAGSTASYSLIGNPIAGLTLNTDGSWSFNPADPAYDSLSAGQQQTITVAYRISDNDGGVTNSSFLINLSGTNDAPVAAAYPSRSATEGAATITGLLKANDVDAADTLSYSLSGNPIAGLTLNTDGSWSFNPADPAYDSLTDGQQQTITVNYRISDNNGGSTDSSFSINLSGTNDSPLADLIAPQNTTEGADAISGQLSSTDPDAGSTASYSLIGNPIAGLTLNTDGSWSFNPADPAYDSLTDGQQQTITVAYRISDNDGGVTDSSFLINLSGTNDSPLADLIAPQNTTEGADAIAGQLSSIDPETDTADTLSYSLSGDPIAGLTLNTDGSWS
ncbi:MAG: hypothetical protein EBX01_05930, partial [Actinobacteria bacterium]|nr:hypothetical protein [Actinomycetota bacterium]